MLRQIDPDPNLADLLRKLTTPRAVAPGNMGKLPQLWELEDGSMYVDDRVARDREINDLIRDCTVRWSIFNLTDESFDKVGDYRSMDRARTAMSRAVVRVVSEADLEEEDAPDDGPEVVEVGPEETLVTLPTPRKRPFEA